MFSHAAVAFYRLTEGVTNSVKVVQAGHGAAELMAGYDGYPPLATVARAQATVAYAQVFFDGKHNDVVWICGKAGVAGMIALATPPPADASTVPVQYLPASCHA